MGTQISNQITNLQNNTARVNFTRGQENLGKTTLSKDAFLQLMMAQLTNQDPTNPTDNNQMLQQQAAMTQVEKLDQLVNIMVGNQLLGQGAQLIGKNVEINVPGGNPVSGTINSVFADSNNQLIIEVGGKNYNSNRINKFLNQV